VTGIGSGEVDDAATASPATVPEATDTGAPAEAAVDGGRDGRWARNEERLAAYDLLAPIRRWIDAPLGRVAGAPSATLVVTLPIALALLAVRSGPVPLTAAAAAVVDRPLVEATLLVAAGYALVFELRKRRIRRMEAAVPDFLDRMASVNEAGVNVVTGLRRVSRSDLGALGPEVRRTRRDIEWGADAQTALRRMDRRARTPMVSRAVTLITNAMEASGDIAPVLRIAADEAQNTRRLRRERRQEMFTYLLVIYISFLVFLGIVVALTVSFIPAIEQAGSAAAAPGGAVVAGTGVPTAVFNSIRGVNVEAYTLLLFHISAIQGVCSGLVAGRLGEGSVRAGVKHAAVMLLVAYLLFAIL
jgi:flagellar protein FlaJ